MSSSYKWIDNFIPKKILPDKYVPPRAARVNWLAPIDDESELAGLEHEFGNTVHVINSCKTFVCLGDEWVQWKRAG